jgi:hypothetical protein
MKIISENIGSTIVCMKNIRKLKNKIDNSDRELTMDIT